MTAFHHLISSCTDANPGRHCRVVTLLFNQNILTMMLTKEPTSKNKPRRQNFTTREPAVTSEFLTTLNLCMYGTQGNTSGNSWNPDREPRTYIIEMNGKLYQRTREHLRPNGRPESGKDGKLLPTFPQVTSEMAFDQQTSNKQPATPPPKVDSNPVAHTIPMEDLNPVSPTLMRKTIGSPVKSRSEDEVIVVRGGNISFQPRSQVTRTGRQSPNQIQGLTAFRSKWHLLIILVVLVVCSKY